MTQPPLAPADAPPKLWPAFDRRFHAAMCKAATSDRGRQIRAELEASFDYAEGKPFLLGPPLVIGAERGRYLKDFVTAYHRAIETVVERSRGDEELLEALSVAPDMADDLVADTAPANGRVHICRLDLLPSEDGGFYVLETNANCPGGFVFSGVINRAWRAFLDEAGVALPAALPHEEEHWMARWVLDVAEAETGVRPEYVPILRPDGGNRLELADFVECFHGLGVESEEIDPRGLDLGRQGAPTVGGRAVSHAYLKLGLQPFLSMRPDLDDFVAAVRERRLFVQNGQRGRWIGDSKLCLAVLSDPKFRHLFDPADWALFERHVPWSRNVGLLPRAEIERVRRDKDRFVLKRPLDTRARGVVVGTEEGQTEWEEALLVAVRHGWLVQEFHPTTEIEAGFDDGEIFRHDLALGAINGEVSVAFVRSSGEYRVNMARSGQMHPVFMEI